MCGICGFTLPSGGQKPSGNLLAAMLAPLRHRGPDQGGTWLDDRMALGHRRLSIIDLATGGQPMQSAKGCVVCFNGEIYNYKELRAELSAGFEFRTNSDTEVILAAWQALGPRCLERFNGMFAFALYDPAARMLFLARDRLGKKPLFYFHHAGIFAFASEIKSLLAHPSVRQRPELDPEALCDYFAVGYILAPKTVFRSIRRLPAGHCAALDLRTGTFDVRPYWQLAESFLAKRSPDLDLHAGEFRELFFDAVRLRLRSDVPLGAFLSGGVDSTSVVAAMRAEKVRTRAYCVRFEQDSYDESPYARLAAQRLGVDLAVILQPLPGMAELRRIVWHLDEPFCDTSILPTYLVCKAARQFATVILSGDGADEILAGYSTYLADAVQPFCALLPRWAQGLLLATARRLLRPSYRKVSIDYKLVQFLKGAGLDRERAHYSWREIFSAQERERLLSPEFVAAGGGYDPFETFERHFREVRGLRFLDKALYVDIKTWLADDILVKVDRMSMAHSLEVRSPFLDHRLVEFAAGLPAGEKMRGTAQKVVLRRAMQGVLPRETLRRAKRGFNFPAHLLGEGALAPPAWPEIFRPDFGLDPKREDVTYKSFCLLIFTIWYEMYSKYVKTGSWESLTNEE